MPDAGTRIGIYIVLITFVGAIQHNSKALLVSSIVSLFIIVVLKGVLKDMSEQAIPKESSSKKAEEVIKLTYWKYWEGEVYGRHANESFRPLRTGEAHYVTNVEGESVRIPLSEVEGELKRGDILVNVYGVYFELQEKDEDYL